MISRKANLITNDLKSDLNELENIVDDFELSDSIKNALLNVVSHIALWTDSQRQDYYDTLYNALYPEELRYPDLLTGNIINGYYYDASGNAVKTYEGLYNDFINEKYFRIKHDKSYIWVRGFDGYKNLDEPELGATLPYRICYYDKNKNFISRQISQQYNVFGEVEPRYLVLTPPSGAKYFRVSWQRPSLGNIYEAVPNLYAVTVVLANLDDGTILSPTQLIERLSITRDGKDVTDNVMFGKPELKPSDVSTVGYNKYWEYNVFNILSGGSPEYGEQNPSTTTRIMNRFAFLCEPGDIIHFNNIKAGVRAERISDGYLQYTRTWIVDNSDFVIGGDE